MAKNIRARHSIKEIEIDRQLDKETKAREKSGPSPVSQVQTPKSAGCDLLGTSSQASFCITNIEGAAYRPYNMVQQGVADSEVEVGSYQHGH